MRVKIQGVGGITNSVEYEFPEGVSVLRAPNAWGKTSIAKGLVSLMTSQITAEDLLNVESDKGYIIVEMNGKKYYRRFVRKKNGIIEEEKRLITDDPRALLLGYFSPENRLVNYILSGNDDITWFFEEASRIKELINKRNNIENDIKESEKEIENLRKEYSEVERLKSELNKVMDEIEKLVEQKNSITRKAIESVETSKRNRAEELKKRLSLKIEAKSKLEEKINEMINELNRLNEELSKEGIEHIKSDIENIEKKLVELSKKKGELEGRLKSLNLLMTEATEAGEGKLETCPLCGSHVNPEIWRERLQHILTEIREYTNQQRSLIEEEVKLQGKKKELESLIKAYEEKLKKRDELIRGIERAKKELSDIELQIKDLETQIKTNEERLKRETKLGSGMSEIDERIKELEEKRKELEYELQHHKPQTEILEEIQRLTTHVEQLKKTKDLLEEQISRTTLMIIENFERELKKLISKLEFNFDAKIVVDNGRMILKVYKNGNELGVKRLSASERTSLALALFTAAIKTFFRPAIVVVDESLMTFDEKRFEAIVKYLTDFTNYVIVTKSDVIQSLETEQVPMVQRA